MTSADEFLHARGIAPAVWAARGCRRYQPGDRWVVDAFRPFLPASRLGTITRIVNQGPGWVMPKHPPPGFEPIPPQIRPDRPVMLDSQTVWHHHAALCWGDCWPVFPPEAGAAAGKPLPRSRVLWGATADAHIATKHDGIAVDVVHAHPPEGAKYLLLGEAKRIDLHPIARDLLPDADVVFFVLEGGPKTDAVISAGGVAFAVPSVTLWDARELAVFAHQHLGGKTVLVVPDADWATNWQVERQALAARTVLRRLGIDAHVCAPPPEDQTGDYHKGIDDHLGAGYTLGDMVIAGREPPITRIWAATRNLPHQRRRSAAYALENLSLYSDKHGELTPSFQSLKRLLDIRHARRVLPVLDAIEHTYTVTSGSLDTIQRSPVKGVQVTEWAKPPTIKLNDYYQAYRRRAKLTSEDFWKDAALELLREDVQELKAWRREHDRHQAA